MAAKKPKLDFMIVSDDIREEIGNKISLIGIYNDKMYVTKLPFVLPKLCFYFSYSNLNKDDKIEIIFQDPSGKAIQAPVKGSLPKDMKGHSNFRIFTIYSPLKIEAEGEYKILSSINQGKKRSSDTEISFFVHVDK